MVRMENNQKKRQIVPVTLAKKSYRSTYEVKHDKNSNINYISVMDTKIDLFLSTAAGISPLKPVERYISKEIGFNKIPYPNAFDLHNKTMFGVDLYDQHCSDVCI